LLSKLQNTANTTVGEGLKRKCFQRGRNWRRSRSLVCGTGLPVPTLFLHCLYVVSTAHWLQLSLSAVLPQRSKVLAPPATLRNVPLQTSFHAGSVAVKIGGPFRMHPATLDHEWWFVNVCIMVYTIRQSNMSIDNSWKWRFIAGKIVAMFDRVYIVVLYTYILYIIYDLYDIMSWSKWKKNTIGTHDELWQSSIYIGLWTPLVSFTKRGQPQPLLTSPVFHAPGNPKQLALQRFRSGGESSASHVLGLRKISDHPWTIKHFRNINGWSHGNVMQSYHFQIWHL